MAPAYSVPFVLVALASVGSASAGLEPLPSHLSVSLSAKSASAFDPNHDDLDLLVKVTNNHQHGDVFLANPSHTLAHPLGPNFLFDKPHAALPRHSVASTFRIVTERHHVEALEDVTKDGIRLAPNGGSAEFHVRATDHLAFHRASSFNMSLEIPLHARYNGKDVRSFKAVTNQVEVEVKDGTNRHLLENRNLETDQTFEFESCLSDEKRTIELWMEGALEAVQRADLELVGGTFATKGRQFAQNRDFCYSAEMTPPQQLDVKNGLDRLKESILAYKMTFKCDPKDATPLCKPILDKTVQIQQVGHSTVVLDSGEAPTITLCAAFFATAHNCAYQAESAPNLLLGLLSQALGVTSVRPAAAEADEASKEILHSPGRPVLTTLEIESAVTDTWSQQCFTQDPRGNDAQKGTLCAGQYQQAHNQLIAYHLTDLQQDFKDMGLVSHNVDALKTEVLDANSNQGNPTAFKAILKEVEDKEWVGMIQYATLNTKNNFVGKNKRAFSQFMIDVGRKNPKDCPTAIDLLAETASLAAGEAIALAYAVAQVYGSTETDTPLSNTRELLTVGSSGLPKIFFDNHMAMTKLKAARFAVLFRCKNEQIHVVRAISQRYRKTFLETFDKKLPSGLLYFDKLADPEGSRDALKNGFKKYWARVLRSVKDTPLETSSEQLREAAMGATLATIGASTLSSNPQEDELIPALVDWSVDVPKYYRLRNVSKWMYKVMLRSLSMLENFFVDEAALRAAGFGWVAGRVKTTFPNAQSNIRKFHEMLEDTLP